MKRSFWVVALAVAVVALGAEADPVNDPRAGRTFIPTKVFAAEDDAKVLALFDGLRVADVVDGMDKAGLHGIGLMDSSILPAWKDTRSGAHRFRGIAVTARYVPTQGPPAGKLAPEEYDRWAGEWYSKRSSEPFAPILRKGSA